MIIQISAVLPRDAHQDVIVYHSKKEKNKIIGTGSLRRKAQWLRKYPEYKVEVEEYRKIDPISQVEKIIISKKYAKKSDLEKIEKKVKSTITECEEFAESSPFPDKSVMYDVVYEQKDYPFIKHKID